MDIIGVKPTDICMEDVLIYDRYKESTITERGNWHTLDKRKDTTYTHPMFVHRNQDFIFKLDPKLKE